MTVILVEKETSFENNELIKLELVKQTKIKSCCFDYKWKFWVNAVAAFAPFFERERFLNGIS